MLEAPIPETAYGYKRSGGFSLGTGDVPTRLAPKSTCVTGRWLGSMPWYFLARNIFCGGGLQKAIAICAFDSNYTISLEILEILSAANS